MTASRTYIKGLVWVFLIGLALWVVASFFGVIGDVCFSPFEIFFDAIKSLFSIVQEIIDLLPDLPDLPDLP